MSQNVYVPAKWQMVKFCKNGQVRLSVLGSWFGSLTEGQSWRLSSGATQIEETDDAWVVTNHSGSTYVCTKGKEGVHSLALMQLSVWKEKAKAEPNYTVEGVTMEQATQELAK